MSAIQPHYYRKCNCSPFCPYCVECTDGKNHIPLPSIFGGKIDE